MAEEQEQPPAVSPESMLWAAPSPWIVPESVVLPGQERQPILPAHPPPYWPAVPVSQPDPALVIAAVIPDPGGDFVLAYPAVRPIQSGVAIGSLVSGIVSLLLAITVLCFGAIGVGAGWGPSVAGAFAVLGVLSGLAGLALGWVALRQVMRSAGGVSGRGIALLGLSSGGCGVIGTLGAMLLVVLLTR
jgi:hypothetical protein